jgi:hypothetical protein
MARVGPLQGTCVSDTTTGASRQGITTGPNEMYPSEALARYRRKALFESPRATA